MFNNTLGEREAHSADGKTYILHSGERRWDVVVKGALQDTKGTRENARVAIRDLKMRPWNQLPVPPPLRFSTALLAAILVGCGAGRTA